MVIFFSYVESVYFNQFSALFACKLSDVGPCQILICW